MLSQRVQPKLNRRLRRLSRKSQSGIVIVVALFIVALVSVMAYAMMERLSRDTRRTELMVRNTQAYWYAKGSLAWAKVTLIRHWQHQIKDRLVDPMPLISKEDVVNAYHIQSKIEDAQSRFNLNNLSDVRYQSAFKRLIQQVDSTSPEKHPTLSKEEIDHIAQATLLWLMKKQGENEAEGKNPIAPRGDHREYMSVSDWLLVKGVTPPLYTMMRPYLIALPGVTKVNIQTASAPVLASLSATLSLSGAKALIQLREQKPWVSVDAFLALDNLKNNPIEKTQITVVSDYFLVETKVDIENQPILFYTLVERVINKGKPTIQTLWQSKGIW